MHSSSTYDRQLRGQIRFVFGYCTHGLVTCYNDQIISFRQAWAGELPGVPKDIIFKVSIIQSHRSRQAWAGETTLFLFLLYRPETRQRLARYF